MRTSGPGRCSRDFHADRMGNDCHRRSWSNCESRSDTGFTLIEVMVVLVIMGLFVGLVSTIIKPDDRALLRLETERLAQLLDLAATESRLTGKRIAWTAEAAGYRFWRFSDDTEWSEIRDVDSLRPRLLPEGMKVAGLRVENARTAEKMRLEFTPFGPTLSFAIALTFGVASYSVEGSPIGEISIVPDDRKKNDQTAPH
jgi:general secretion pathway protein H